MTLSKLFVQLRRKVHPLGVLSSYTSSDWKNLVRYNKYEYTPKIIYTDQFYTVKLISWLPGQDTAVHLHENDCYYKILDGRLNEYIYTKDFEYICTREHATGFVTQSPIDFNHKIVNKEDKPAVSLNIYPLKISPKIKYDFLYPGGGLQPSSVFDSYKRKMFV